uniref:Uncharacterized protein n=1 Tax=Anguilla anguilla TaxID=7936 RepID=A0A0E9TY99_ANGAN
MAIVCILQQCIETDIHISNS